MSNKKLSKSKMRDTAFKKENLRLQRKIFAQQAKISSLENELLLRPSYSPPKPWRSVHKIVEDYGNRLAKLKTIANKSTDKASLRASKSKRSTKNKTTQ